MPEHTIGTREEWQAARDELAKLEAEHAELGQKLTQQRREVLSHPGRLASLAREPDSPHVELIPRPKKWAKNGVNLYTKKSYGNDNGTPLAPPDESTVIENAGPPVCERIALTS